MASANPNYDVIAAIDALMPGVVLQRSLLNAAQAAYAAKGFVPLVAADVAGILAAASATDAYGSALPVYPAKVKRLSDSNPSTDGWATDRDLLS